MISKKKTVILKKKIPPSHRRFSAQFPGFHTVAGDGFEPMPPVPAVPPLATDGPLPRDGRRRSRVWRGRAGGLFGGRGLWGDGSPVWIGAQCSSA